MTNGMNSGLLCRSFNADGAQSNTHIFPKNDKIVVWNWRERPKSNLLWWHFWLNQDVFHKGFRCARHVPKSCWGEFLLPCLHDRQTSTLCRSLLRAEEVGLYLETIVWLKNVCANLLGKITWHDSSELLRVAVDQTVFQRPSSDTLRSNQHQRLSLERWHSRDFFVQRRVGFVEVAVGFRSVECFDLALRYSRPANSNFVHKVSFTRNKGLATFFQVLRWNQPNGTLGSSMFGLPPDGILYTNDLQDVSAWKGQPDVLAWQKLVYWWIVLKQGTHVALEWINQEKFEIIAFSPKSVFDWECQHTITNVRVQKIKICPIFLEFSNNFLQFCLLNCIQN